MLGVCQEDLSSLAAAQLLEVFHLELGFAFGDWCAEHVRELVREVALLAEELGCEFRMDLSFLVWLIVLSAVSMFVLIVGFVYVQYTGHRHWRPILQPVRRCVQRSMTMLLGRLRLFFRVGLFGC